ncbi:MAG: hypothetical protein MJ252_01430 [archaeon]|nr:hypothetical protein [archaeon]
MDDSQAVKIKNYYDDKPFNKLNNPKTNQKETENQKLNLNSQESNTQKVEIKDENNNIRNYQTNLKFYNSPNYLQNQQIPQYNNYQENLPDQLGPNNNYQMQPIQICPPQPINQNYVQFAGSQMIIIQNPLQELQNSISCTIIQELELLEILTGCETANRYNVFVEDSLGITKFLFKCKEESNCFERNCCPSSARSLDMKIKHVTQLNYLQNDFDHPYLILNKPFKCTCFCLARPEMINLFVENSKTFGKVKEQCTCTDPEITINDSNNNLKYIITADCCQCGYLCRNNIFGKLSECNFKIIEAASNTEVGKIIRKVAGFQNLVSDADIFQIIFPINATPEDKLNLISGTLMIDYMYFESNGENEGNGGRRRYY